MQPLSASDEGATGQASWQAQVCLPRVWQCAYAAPVAAPQGAKRPGVTL